MEAMFQPGATTGWVADQAYQGLAAQQSMMQRASQLQQDQQMSQIRQQQIDQNNILRPVLEAQSKAKILSATSALTNHVEMENLKSQAAVASVPANKEFLDISQLSDWDEQAAQFSRLQAKISWMGNVRDDQGNQVYGGFLKAVDEARANAIIRAKTDQALEAEQARAETMASARMDASGNMLQGRIYAADASAGARTYAADAGAGARVQSSNIAAGAKQASTASIMDRTQYKELMQAAAQNDALAAKMSAAGSEANAAIYRKHAQDFRDRADAMTAKPDQSNNFTVPNVTDGQSPTPAADAPAQEPPPAEKLYVPPSRPGDSPSFSPQVKTPQDVIKAFQQMVDDGVINADQARESLSKLGFKRKGE